MRVRLVVKMLAGLVTQQDLYLIGITVCQLLDFASRHGIAPQTEHFPMSSINQAFARLESGKARYRIVLDADF